MYSTCARLRSSVALLEKDAGLRRNFFQPARVLFYAGSGPQNLWERIERWPQSEKSGRLAMLSAWGSTGDLAARQLGALPHAARRRHRSAGRRWRAEAGAFGGKARGAGRGANVTPVTTSAPTDRAAFDDEGFYRIGDAVKFADRRTPRKDRLRRRVAETSALHRHVGERRAVRIRLIAAADP